MVDDCLKQLYIRGIKSTFEIDLIMFVLESSFKTDRENVKGIFVVKTWNLKRDVVILKPIFYNFQLKTLNYLEIQKLLQLFYIKTFACTCLQIRILIFMFYAVIKLWQRLKDLVEGFPGRLERNTVSSTCRSSTSLPIQRQFS